MEVAVSTMEDALSMPGVHFAIPAYQRRYAWQQRQCEELWLDLMRAARHDAGHFTGTLLYEEGAPDAAGVRELSVVDGQQRLTTISLMMVALRNFLREHPDRAPAGVDAAQLTEKCLAAPSDKGREGLSAGPKLRLSRLDAKSMAQAVEGASAPAIASRNVSRNLAYFESLMAEEGFDAEAFLRGLGHLNIVMAKLGEGDDPQAVFESLNSKGLQLNIGDMVRNYLLASETHDEQTRLYLEYWTVIEGVFDPDPGSLKLDTMIKAWLSVRFPKVRARTPEEVYSAFKRYYNDEYAGDLEPVLGELRSFSMVWAENYRYHAVKKFRSMPWATNGAQTLTSGYELKRAHNEEYAERMRAELRAMGREI